MVNTEEGVKKRKHSCPVGENVHWCIYEEQYGGFLKKENQKKKFQYYFSYCEGRQPFFLPFLQ